MRKAFKGLAEGKAAKKLQWGRNLTVAEGAVTGGSAELSFEGFNGAAT